MDRILIEMLGNGSLPLYDIQCENYFEWMPPFWNVLESRGRQRCLFNLDIDEPLTLCVDAFATRLGALREALIAAHNEVRRGAGPLEDVPLEDVPLEAVPYFDGPGTLILALRTCYSDENREWPYDRSDREGVPAWDGFWDTEEGRVADRHGCTWVMGGMAYFPGVQVGVPLGEFSPTYWVEQTCLRLAEREYDHAVPLIEPYPHAIPEFTPEDRARAEEMTRNFEKIQQRNREADVRAEAILRSHLDETQLAEFQEGQKFHVTGKDGFTYLIVKRAIHNVFRVEGEEVTREYCLVTASKVPTFDQMLTQKLLLEANPEHFHEKTNAWDLTGGMRRLLNPGVVELERVEELRVVANPGNAMRRLMARLEARRRES